MCTRHFFWCLFLILLDCVCVCNGEKRSNKCVELKNCEGTLVPVFIKDNIGEHCACVRWDNGGARCSKLYFVAHILGVMLGKNK